jgi:hypothetical protein
MKPDVPASLHRVVRSRRAGNWRDWFCPDDVEHYRPLFSAFMRRYGYADDWTLESARESRRRRRANTCCALARERRGERSAVAQ